LLLASKAPNEKKAPIGAFFVDKIYKNKIISFFYGFYLKDYTLGVIFSVMFCIIRAPYVTNCLFITFKVAYW